MKHYLKVYREFFRTSFSEASSYRLNFFLLFFVDLAFYFTSLASLHIIFSYVDYIGDWNREQFMFFFSFMMMVDNMHMIIISINFWLLADDLKLGNLDFKLLRPIHSIFLVFFHRVRISSLPSSLFTGGMMIYFAIQVNLSLTSWILLPLMLILSFTLLALIEFLISTLMFWTLEGNGINFLRMQLQHMQEYPDFIYHKIFRRILTYTIPILLAASAPVHFLFKPAKNWPQLCVLVTAILILSWLLSRIWRIALNRYESASS